MTDVSFEGKGLKLETESDAEPIIKEIKSAGENLRILKLSGNTIGVEAAEAIASVLSHDSIQIHTADLSDIFTGRLLKEIPPALKAFSNALINKKSLKVLNLSDNAVWSCRGGKYSTSFN